MARRPPIDRRASITGVLRDVRPVEFIDKAGDVEVFIAAKCERLGPAGVGLDYVKRRQPLRMTVGRVRQASTRSPEPSRATRR
jgi:hypothetical protein